MVPYLKIFLPGGVLLSFSASANPVVRRIEQAAPAYRIIHLLNYFDTCQAVTQHRDYAFRVLHEIDEIGEREHDSRLRSYCQFLKDTHAKHGNLTDPQRAELFLRVGRRAAQDGDPQIAAVCRHFAGQYNYLSEEYGLAFQHLPTANRAFRTIGFDNVPEISRYLYELALDYYYFREFGKVIPLLREAARYPAFSVNLNIQTYNTMALACARLGQRDSASRDEGFKQAERNYYQNISPAEERLIALSQLHLDTRQMGRMLGISPDSIHKTKYRLRKRLGISADSPLSEVLKFPSEPVSTF